MTFSDNQSHSTLISRWQSTPYSSVADLVSNIGPNHYRVTMINFGSLDAANRDTLRNADAIRIHLGVGNYTEDTSNALSYNLTSENEAEGSLALLSMIMEVESNGQTVRAANESLAIHTKTGFGHLGRHFGVSRGYEQAAFSNWTACETPGISELFYINPPYTGSSLITEGSSSSGSMNNLYAPPEKIRFFRLPEDDLQSLKANIDMLGDLWVVLGVTYGHYQINKLNINPIFGGLILADPSQNRIQSDLLLDVLTPCPPVCN